MTSTSFCRLLPVVSFLSLVCLWAQSSGSERLSVGQAQKIAGKRNQVVQTKIPVSILPGYHVNSNKPSEDYLIPLSLKWSSLGALEGGQVVYPKPSLEKYDFAEKPLSVYTGNFDLTVNFKVGGTAAAGPGIATGKLSYQACNSNTCFPPKSIEVNVPYQIN